MSSLQNYHQLFRNAKHGISRWTIWSEGDTIYFESESKIGDTPTKYFEHVPAGKASRSLDEQIKSRVDSRISNKLDNGYVYTKEEATKPLTNTLGLYKPMLAVKYRDVKGLKIENCYIQPKLDGHRCIMTNQESEITCYSRAGKLIHTMDHIIRELDLPEGITTDGELYHHGTPLQTISSWAKRLQANSAKLKYFIYDIIDESMCYEERLDMLRQIGRYNPHVSICPTKKVSDIPNFNLTSYLRNTINSGYEGLILRPSDSNYEIGRRSKGLIKVKALEDDEAKVIGVTASKDGWGILHCRAKNGQIFKMSAPGTIPQKRHVLENIEDYIGKQVTYEYSMLTNDKKPFHAVALRWREDL